MSRELTQVADTKFELCHHVEQVLKIGRDFQKQDVWRGAHHDTAKLLCDTIEYLRDQLPKPDPDWKEICEKCHDGEIEPKECEYYGEPDGCNSPIYGEHPKANPGNAAAMREALRLCREEMCDRCDNEKPCKLKCVHVGIIDRALSDPPRNCDVGTAEEQDARFVTWRYSKPVRTELGLDALVWAQMPYKKGCAK